MTLCWGFRREFGHLHPPGHLLLQSMPPNSALILRVGVSQPFNPQKAAWPHPAPSAWAERQRLANQSQFSSDADIWGFQKLILRTPCPCTALGHTGPHFPQNLLPSPLLTAPGQRCVTAGHFTGYFFTSFPQNSPAPGERRVFGCCSTSSAKPCGKSTEQNYSPASSAASRLYGRAIFPIPRDYKLRSSQI